jgi:hypothetical protein
VGNIISENWKTLGPQFAESNDISRSLCSFIYLWKYRDKCSAGRRMQWNASWDILELAVAGTSVPAALQDFRSSWCRMVTHEMIWLGPLITLIAAYASNNEVRQVRGVLRCCELWAGSCEHAAVEKLQNILNCRKQSIFRSTERTFSSTVGQMYVHMCIRTHICSCVHTYSDS